ncbi:MAG: LptF/LptG family permease, partial [Nitrospinota bacterium]
ICAYRCAIAGWRSGKSGGLALSLAIIVFYYVLLSMGEGLGDSGYIPPVVAMWIPNAALAAIGAYLVTKVQRDSPFRTAAWLGARMQDAWDTLRRRLFPQGFGPLEGGEA